MDKEKLEGLFINLDNTLHTLENQVLNCNTARDALISRLKLAQYFMDQIKAELTTG